MRAEAFELGQYTNILLSFALYTCIHVHTYGIKHMLLYRSRFAVLLILYNSSRAERNMETDIAHLADDPYKAPAGRY